MRSTNFPLHAVSFNSFRVKEQIFFFGPALRRVTRMKEKTIIITSVSAFIRHRSASQSFPLAARLNRALVGSTCHMGGSRGGWGAGGGRKESCSSRLTFLQYPSQPPSQPLVSLQRGLLGNKVCIETSVHSLASRCLELFQIVAFFFLSLPLALSLYHFYLKEGPTFFFFFSPFKSLANWFLRRLKHALILVMPDGARKIFTGV